MFEHLPVVSEATLKASMDRHEAEEIAKDINKRIVGLAVNNRYLSTAILMCAEVVAVNFKGHTKETVKADTGAALLLILSLIDKELEESAERI